MDSLESGTRDYVDEACHCQPSLLPLPLAPQAPCGAPRSERRPTLAPGHTGWLSPHTPASTAGKARLTGGRGSLS